MNDYNKQKRAKLISDKLDELNPAKSSLMYWVAILSFVAGFAIGYFIGDWNWIDLL